MTNNQKWSRLHPNPPKLSTRFYPFLWSIGMETVRILSVTNTKLPPLSIHVLPVIRKFLILSFWMKKRAAFMHLSTPPSIHRRPLVATNTLFCFLVYMSVHISHSFLRRPTFTKRFVHRVSANCQISRLLLSTNTNTNIRMTDRSPPIVVIISGPTATGKSDVAAKLCAQQKGMIVSADSVQAYRGVQIGANKPSLEERKETPHILIDVADHEENYNAAEWREDAIYCIQTLLGRSTEEQKGADATTPAASSSRRVQIKEYIQQSRIEKGYDCENDTEQDQRILPVICGGTMMYLQWLVHGRPDAMRPTPKAVGISYQTIQKFQKSNNDYDGAVQHVASYGKVFADRAQKLSLGDWYRLRRTLEIALTIEEKKEENVNVDNLVEQLYSGERQGGLSSLDFDVRCFFLCPDDRMSHTGIVDKRCEQMLMRGLLKETTELGLSGRLPDMAEKAIGYRQTLDYLKKEGQKDDADEDARASEEKAFGFYLNEFTTATRRYAKKQMAWFRKDKEFMFVPISLKLDKPDRVSAAANAINRLCGLSREDYERELFGGEDYVSGKTKRQNEDQGKKMKFYKPTRHILTLGSKEYEDILTEAIKCRSRFRSNNDKKRLREDDPSTTSKK